MILKIAINSGIISAGASLFPLAWPPVVVKMFQVYAVASASAVGDSLSADCALRESILRPVQAWALTMVIVPVLIVFLWIVLFTLVLVDNLDSKYTKVHLPVSIIVTLLFVHPVITKAAIKLVACRDIAGKRFLDADFLISCNSSEYSAWVWSIAIPIFLFFTFGIPIFYAFAMYRHIREDRLEDLREVYGFFFSGFTKNAWWFELWNTIRKSLFTIASVLFAPAGVAMQTWAALVLLLSYVVVFSTTQPCTCCL